ncbi:MAG: hypothetical protein JSV24_06500 [Bacteroidales bacterium]|nr:MAG: hypothetical protein JSV24_06500 [Bacteroidales bacterium]
MCLNNFRIGLMVCTGLFFVTLHMAAQQDSEEVPRQYVFPVFTRGSVVMKNGITKPSVLNYNTVTQEMIFEQNGKRLALDRLGTIDTVIINRRKFIPVGEVFYELALEAPVSLFIQHKSDITSEGKPIGYGTTRQTTSSTSFSKLMETNAIYDLKLPDEFYVTGSSINWIRINGTMMKFITRRQFLKIFPEQEDELKQYIKGNKIDLKDREDLIQLVVYCNELNPE